MIYKVKQLANYPNCSYSGYYQKFLALDLNTEEVLGIVDTPKDGENEFAEDWVLVREKLVEAETPTSAIMKLRYWESSNLPESWLLENDVKFNWFV